MLMQVLRVNWEFHKFTFHFFTHLFSLNIFTTAFAMLLEMRGEVSQLPHFPMPYTSLEAILKEVYA